MSQNINEWLSCKLFGRGHVSCRKAIQIVVGYILSVTPFVTATSRLVIKTEPHPFYTTVCFGDVSNRVIRDSFPPPTAVPGPTKGALHSSQSHTKCILLYTCPTLG